MDLTASRAIHAVHRRLYLGTAREAWVIAFGLALLVFLSTAHWRAGQNTDGLVAALPGWHLITHGTLDLAGYVKPDSLPGVVAAGDRVVVARTMGVILAGLPGAVLLGWTGATPAVTGALSASLLSAAAVANVFLALRPVVPRVAAGLAAVTLALGTGMWTLASAELWTHGPDAFWLSLALLLASQRYWLMTGMAFAPAILTRPHLAVAAAVVGIWMSVVLRSWRPIVLVGLPSSAAVGVLTLWNSWYYDAATVGGTYAYAVPNATRSPWDGAGLFAENMAGVLVSPLSGVLVYSPVLLVVLWATATGYWRQPAWASAFAVAGVAYLVVQMRISASFEGGAGYYGNRYGIETLVALTPYAAGAVTAWCGGSRTRLTWFAGAAGASVAIHAFGAFLTYWWVGLGSASSWTSWYPYSVARAAGASGVAAAAASLALVVLSVVVARRHQPSAPTASMPTALRSRSSAPPAGPPGAAASPPR